MERTERSSGDERGFTIVELVVAIGLAAFMFATLASVMIGSLRALSIQKSRTQANDLATVGIEDLQRLTYNALGLCNAPSGTPPSGLSDTALLPNCGASPVKYGPCAAGAAPANAVPDEEYDCVVRSITYKVKRYVAFGDVAHTEKRLAVLVEWVDQGGRHLVSQQSSLRIPSQSAIVGLALPVVKNSASSVSPSTMTLNANGTNATELTLSAQTQGLDAAKGDTVIAVFETLGDTGRQQGSVALTQTSTNVWEGKLVPGTFKFGPGTQYVVFNGTRKQDGKVGSLVKTPAITVSGAPPYAPTLTMVTQPPSSVSINSQGGLNSSFNIAVKTTNISPDDQVTMTFETQTGAVSLAMVPDPWTGGACSTTQCETTWRATLGPSHGYMFFPSPPNRRFYITAKQNPSSVYGVDSGATVTVSTNEVTFS